jgi:Zn-dependent metalloprotease
VKTSPPSSKFRQYSLLIIVAAVIGLTPAVRSQGKSDPIDPSFIHVDPANHGITVFKTGEYLSGPSNGQPENIALKYVKDHGSQFGLGDSDLDSLYIVQVHERTTGVAVVQIGQRIAGLRVHTALLVATLDARGRLVMVGGRTATDSRSGQVSLTAGQALAIAAARQGADAKQLPQGAATRARGPHRFQNVYARKLRNPEPIKAEQVWFITDAGLRLAWLTDIESEPGVWFGTVVDAESGAILARQSRYKHAADADVYTQQHPDAAGASRTRENLTGINGTWVSGTKTSGNNVNAYLDRNDDDANNEYQPDDTDAHFRYSFTDAWRGLPDGTDLDDLAAGTVTTALDADRDAAITQLFYYTNVMHDWLWGFGFDEASGNFQVSNPSGDGAAGDAVQAEAQDGFDNGCVEDGTGDPIPCLNNANFGTDGDGTTARMQMYMWARPDRPYRDGSMDGDVIAHEYGHGVSNRLVPGTISGATDQAGSLGEGWSDAISFLKWGDTTVGEYVTGNTTRGIRSSAYDVHPDTYGDYSTSVGSPHRNGEIWAATMFEIRTRLGINTTAQLMLDGMRSTLNGPSPTFLDARNGILANDQAANGEANRCALWAAFAVRGMGENAVSNGLHAVPTEDFTIPANCRPVADAGGPYFTIEGTDVSVSAAGSTSASHASGGAITKYEWDLDNDGQFDDAVGVSASFTRVGQDGPYTIGVRITDQWGATDEDAGTVNVANVAPTVVIFPIPVIDEHGTTTITGLITDPGWLDILSATIDLGDGAGPQPLAGAVENNRPDSTFTFAVNKQYGDNGSFAVTVVGLDDDTSTPAAAIAKVNNVNPTAVIDESGTQDYGGKKAFVLDAGGNVTVPASSTDPGSDDLTFTWNWDDGSNSVQTSLVNAPVADPPLSPSVQPRNVTFDKTHTYAAACLYDLVVTVGDDDGGTANDMVAVVVRGNGTISKGSGWWLNQYRPKPPANFTNGTLECYLAITGYFSMVFDDMTRQEAVKILQSPAKSPSLDVFKQQLLAAWLNFANGAIDFDTPVVTIADPNAPPDTTFGAAMLAAELVATNPASTDAQIRAQKAIIERIVTRDEH